MRIELAPHRPRLPQAEEGIPGRQALQHVGQRWSYLFPKGSARQKVRGGAMTMVLGFPGSQRWAGGYVPSITLPPLPPLIRQTSARRLATGAGAVQGSDGGSGRRGGRRRNAHALECPGRGPHVLPAPEPSAPAPRARRHQWRPCSGTSRWMLGSLSCACVCWWGSVYIVCAASCSARAMTAQMCSWP